MAEQVVRYIDRRTLVGFFWGMSRKLALGLLMDDGSGRLFNTSARLNFGQEAELVDRMPSRGFTGWVSLSACQLINKSIQTLSKLLGSQSVSQSTNQSINQSSHQAIKQSSNGLND